MSTRLDTPTDDVAVDAAPADVLRRVYAFFYNKRTGLVLILAMVVLTLFGVLFAQAPAGVRDDPAAYAAWLDAVRPRYRGWTDILSWLGMFRVFSSLPFLLVTALLALSILACSAHRVPRLWAAATRPHTHVSATFFDHGRLRAAVPVAAPPGEAMRRAVGELRARRFRVVEDPGGTDLYADRYRFTPFGTVVAHVAFVVILVGVLVTSAFGFKDEQFTVTVGSTVEVGHDTGLAVELVAFRDEYHPDGTPRDYASDLVLHEDGREVAAKTIRVNDPLRYAGISFNQAFFGVAVEVTVTDPGGTPLWSGGVPLQRGTADGLYTFGSFTLPEEDLEVYVVTAASGQAERSIGAGEARIEVYQPGADTLVASGLVPQGTPTPIGGLTFTFERERQYSGLIVSRDPGAPWVWVGGALLVLGSCAAMFFRHRRVWVRVEPASGGSLVRLVSPDRPDPTFEACFQEIVSALDVERPDRKAGMNA